MFVDKSNLTGVAGRMEAAGLINREQNPDDKRAYKLRLTAQGRKTLENIEGPYWEEVMEVMKQFSTKDIKPLTVMMYAMQKTIQEKM